MRARDRIQNCLISCLSFRAVLHQWQLWSITSVVSFAILSSASFGAHQVSAQSPSTITINPIADAYVAGDLTTSNFGLTTDLQSDASPLRESYLKFDLGPLAGHSILTATLRMWVVDGSNSSHAVKTVADNSWTETALTWAN